MPAPAGLVGSASSLVAGVTGVVRRSIEPLGSVYLAGEEWSARTADGQPLERGIPVRVVSDGRTDPHRRTRPVIIVASLSKGDPRWSSPSWPRPQPSPSSSSSCWSSSACRSGWSSSTRRWSSSDSARRTSRWFASPGLRVPRPGHRPAGQGRRPRAVHRGPQPDDDHQGQRADQRRLPDLLADQRSAQERGERRNFAGALQGVATTTLRAVIGDILLDDVLSKREQINEVLRVKLDEVTERWGGKVTTRRDPRDHAAASPSRTR